MTALAADTARKRRNTHLMRTGEITAADSQTLFQSAMLCHSAAAATVAEAADTASFRIAGICEESLTTGSSNTLKARFVWGHEELMTHDGGVTAAMVGKNVTILDDNTVSIAGTTTNDVLAGMVTEYVSATQVWVAIGVFSTLAA
jgi:hypothetical protein